MRILKLQQPPHSRPVIELNCNGILGARMWRAGWAGFTLPLPFLTLILYWGPPPGPSTRVHEWVHAAQVDRLGWFRFLLIYWRESRKGYRGNALESEAYRIQDLAERDGCPGWAEDKGT